MANKRLLKAINEGNILEHEALLIQEAIEVLNRVGLEHHVANAILQKERDAKRKKANELWEKVPPLA